MLSGPPGTIVWRPANCSHSSLSFQVLGWQRGWARLADQGHRKPTGSGEERKGADNNNIGEKRKGESRSRRQNAHQAHPSLALTVSSLVRSTEGRCSAGNGEKERDTISEGQSTIWKTWDSNRSWKGVLCTVGCSADLFLEEKRGAGYRRRTQEFQVTGAPVAQCSLGSLGLRWYSNLSLSWSRVWRQSRE